jgi:hypothetical protein
MSSMTGGRGGPGDIFKVGKSNAKKVNKVNLQHEMSNLFFMPQLRLDPFSCD